MYFAEFYTRDVQTGELIPACGDRSVYVLDGRTSRATQIQDADKWARTHGFEAFVIYSGPSFTNVEKASAVFHTGRR